MRPLKPTRRLRSNEPAPYKSKPVPGQKAKKLKQLTEAQLKKLEKRYEKKLKVKSTNPHFVQLGAGEAERLLDQIEAEAEGIARRKAYR